MHVKKRKGERKRNRKSERESRTFICVCVCVCVREREREREREAEGWREGLRKERGTGHLGLTSFKIFSKCRFLAVDVVVMLLLLGFCCRCCYYFLFNLLVSCNSNSIMIFRFGLFFIIKFRFAKTQ